MNLPLPSQKHPFHQMKAKSITVKPLNKRLRSDSHYKGWANLYKRDREVLLYQDSLGCFSTLV